MYLQIYLLDGVAGRELIQGVSFVVSVLPKSGRQSTRTITNPKKSVGHDKEQHRLSLHAYSYRSPSRYLTLEIVGN